MNRPTAYSQPEAHIISLPVFHIVAGLRLSLKGPQEPQPAAPAQDLPGGFWFRDALEVGGAPGVFRRPLPGWLFTTCRWAEGELS